MIYRVTMDVAPPTQNNRLEAVLRHWWGSGLPYAKLVRAKGVERWQKSFALVAQAQLRRQGLRKPLDYPVVALLRVWCKGPRDVDSSQKDVLDALEGIAWNKDRAIEMLTLCRPKYGEPKTEVWFTQQKETDPWEAMARVLWAMRR